MRVMAIITVNNPEMTSADWIAHEDLMYQKYTGAFTRNRHVAVLNERQAIYTAEIDEADLPKMDAHIASEESLAFDTRADISAVPFRCEPM